MMQVRTIRQAVEGRTRRALRSLRFARNRIRHRVLPELESARPGATRRIARLAHAAASAERAWRIDAITYGPPAT